MEISVCGDERFLINPFIMQFMLMQLLLTTSDFRLRVILAEVIKCVASLPDGFLHILNDKVILQFPD